MKKSRFWSFIIIATIFTFIGVYLADIIDLPDPFTQSTTRLVYGVLGILLAVLFFSRITAYVVKTAAQLTSTAIRKLAVELSTQVTTHNPFQPQVSTGLISAEGLAKLKQELAGVLILDTSSLIDGRVLEVAKSGFLCGLILIPDFVLKELQLVADSENSLKRARGRRGFEIISQLKRIRHIRVEVWDKQSLMLRNKTLAKLDHSNEKDEVDDRLISLAKTLDGKLLTCDFNLNQVAKIRGVSVLNINELTNALRTLPVPGETLKIKVVHPGKDKGQMVGYLSDGTMVVVKDASLVPDKEVEVIVNKIIQGSAGRMVFATPSKAE